MPKRKTNRQYTNLVRTPESMSWLIKQTETIQGSIDRKQRQIDKYRGEISALKAQFKNLGTVIKMHEISINPKTIQGKEPRRPRIAAHGELQRSVIGILMAADQASVGTTQIAVKLLSKWGMETTLLTIKDVRSRVKYCLKTMAKNGIAIPTHTPAGNGVVVEGYWTLSPSFLAD
ncbi:MAG: hypothetical protein PSV24_11160 [Rhodoferax sp.]|nr:hypothetical protein [Rhodoferax sp.]